MNENNLEYGNLVTLVKPYTDKGRPISIAFLNWMLEHIYRLDQVEAEDVICDKNNDRGLDGVYVDDNQQEIHIFQSRTKQGGTIGDKDLREFSGTLNQLRDEESLGTFLAGKVDQEIKEKLIKLNVQGFLKKGYAVRGVFVTNVPFDANALDVMKGDPAIIGYDRAKLANAYVDLNVEGGVKQKYNLSTDGAPFSFQAGALSKVFVLFADGRELAAMPGIEDGTLFELNVRLPLGNTKVNRAIRDSIGEVGQHVKFSLFHNGVTILAEKVHVQDQQLCIENFVVVNGAQSLKQFQSLKHRLTSDLKVLTRVIEIGSNADLAREISINSNNQNGIKARDLRSNDQLQVRLKQEFEELDFDGYSFDVKRGEEGDGRVISNEYAGKLLLAFDLDEPWSCHQSYKVFDEKYADIFARPEVNAHRILFLSQSMLLIDEALTHLKNRPFATYGLSRFFLLAALKKLFTNDPIGKKLCRTPSVAFDDDRLSCVLEVVADVLKSIVVDLNHDIDQGTFSDYKSDLKSKTSVETELAELLRSYEKDKVRGKVDVISDRLKKCGLA